MECNHDRLKSVNGRIYCCICGAEFPLECLTGKHENPEKAQETEKPNRRKAKKEDKA